MKKIIVGSVLMISSVFANSSLIEEKNLSYALMEEMNLTLTQIEKIYEDVKNIKEEFNKSADFMKTVLKSSYEDNSTLINSLIDAHKNTINKRIIKLENDVFNILDDEVPMYPRSN